MLVVVGKSSAELEAIYRKVIILLIYHSEDVPGWESKRTTTDGPYRQGNNLYMYMIVYGPATSMFFVNYKEDYMFLLTDICSTNL